VTADAEQRHRDLTEWGTGVVRERGLGTSVRIDPIGYLAYVGTDAGVVNVLMYAQQFEGAAFAPHLRGVLAHELGEAMIDRQDPHRVVCEHEREFAADAFAASVIGATPMIESLQFSSEWLTARELAISRASRSHPSAEERIDRLRQLRVSI
jgi:hypothetical protein